MGQCRDTGSGSTINKYHVARLPIDDVRRDHVGWGRLEPAARRGARNALSERVMDVAGLVNEFPEAMVVSSLRSRRGAHDAMLSAGTGVVYSAW